LFADFAQVVAEADNLHDQGKYAEARTLLVEAVETACGREASELYWRASRESKGWETKQTRKSSG
jgi:hypothetical protein